MDLNTMIPMRRRRPRNRFVAGCLGTVTVLLLLASALVWWFVGRPANQVLQSFQELQEAPALEAQLSNRSAFTVPADSELQREQVERFIAVQTAIRDHLEGGVTVLSERYAQLGDQEFNIMDALRMAGAYRDYLKLLTDARTAQIAALNSQGFSAEEYRWVRTETLRAAGLPGIGAQFEGLVGALAGQGSPMPVPVDSSPAPAVNVALIEDMREDLQGVSGLAVLGF